MYMCHTRRLRQRHLSIGSTLGHQNVHVHVEVKTYTSLASCGAVAALAAAPSSLRSPGSSLTRPLRPWPGSAGTSRSAMGATVGVRQAGLTPALCAARSPMASMYERTRTTPPPSRSGDTAMAHVFSSTPTTSVSEAASARTAAPPHASAGTTRASRESRHKSPGRGLSEPSSKLGARARLARTHGKKVWPSSSAHARGARPGSSPSAGSAGACAHGSLSSLVMRWEMIASAPPIASTPSPAR
mmetsp:Transcript_37810/g.122241  ORF Transcript_37810/g.122241 Transcript_37810/m.122241 type:complete len:243 (-) Transcript_37810:638-1366(-)